MSEADRAGLAAGTLCVVVHYGDADLTSRCLYSVAAGTVRPGQTIIVDNGPGAAFNPPGDLALPLRVLRPGHNVGFAAAVNQAARAEAGFERIWLLNNDARCAPTALAELVAAAAAHPRPALVSSLILEDDEATVWFERARFYPWRLESKHVACRSRATSIEVDRARPSPLAIPYLPACSLLVPASIAEPSGLLDPTFFVYGEDIDLSLRARRAGHDLVVARRSVVMHRASSGATSSDRERLVAQAAARIVRREYPLLLPFGVWAGLLLGVIRGLLERKQYRVSGRVRGYRAGLAGNSAEG